MRIRPQTVPAPPAETSDEAAPVSTVSLEEAEEPFRRRVAGHAWTLLLDRIYEAFPLICPPCSSEIRIIAFVIEALVVRDILAHLSEPTHCAGPWPTLWEVQDAQRDEFDLQAQPVPDYEFDQRIARVLR